MGKVMDVVQPPHPFYPIEANIVGYFANELSVSTLLGAFAAGCIVVLGSVALVLRRCKFELSGSDTAAVLWFILSTPYKSSDLTLTGSRMCASLFRR